VDDEADQARAAGPWMTRLVCGTSQRADKLVLGGREASRRRAGSGRRVAASQAAGETGFPPGSAASGGPTPPEKPPRAKPRPPAAARTWARSRAVAETPPVVWADPQRIEGD